MTKLFPSEEKGPLIGHGTKEEIMGYLRKARESMGSGDKRIIVSKSWKTFNTLRELN